MKSNERRQRDPDNKTKCEYPRSAYLGASRGATRSAIFRAGKFYVLPRHTAKHRSPLTGHHALAKVFEHARNNTSRCAFEKWKSKNKDSVFWQLVPG